MRCQPTRRRSPGKGKLTARHTAAMPIALRSHRETAPQPQPPEPPVAKKRRRSGSSTSVLNRVMDRSIKGTIQSAFQKQCTREQFANMTRRVSVDIFNAPDAPPGLDLMMTQRHRIIEICAAGGSAFGLTENGVCASYCTRTGRRLCVLNKDHTEVIRSLFHNKAAKTLITVSVFAADGYACLRCRHSQLEHLKNGIVDQSVALFESESLRWPGFVEFDDVNGKVLTFSSDVNVYKVWSLAEPSQVLYSFSDQTISEGICEIKISPGIMLIVCNKQEETSIPLHLLSIETGETLRSLRQPVRRGKKVDIIEQVRHLHTSPSSRDTFSHAFASFSHTFAHPRHHRAAAPPRAPTGRTSQSYLVCACAPPSVFSAAHTLRARSRPSRLRANRSSTRSSCSSRRACRC